MKTLPEPILQPVAGSEDLYRLHEPFSVTVAGISVTVAAGFETDGASIPAALWCLIDDPLAPEIAGPAVIHDALYSSELVSRSQADSILYDLCRCYGMGYIKAHEVWAGVRIGGWCVWRGHTPASVQAARMLVTVAP